MRAGFEHIPEDATVSLLHTAAAVAATNGNHYISNSIPTRLLRLLLLLSCLQDRVTSVGFARGRHILSSALLAVRAGGRPGGRLGQHVGGMRLTSSIAYCFVLCSPCPAASDDSAGYTAGPADIAPTLMTSDVISGRKRSIT